MPTAVEKVFSTTELLVAILLEVDDMQTLLLSQRVSKDFHDAIGDSICLQRALWFKPMPPDPSLPEDKCLRNPLIGKFKRRLGVDEVAHGTARKLDKDEYWPEKNEKGGNAKFIKLYKITRRQGSWRKMLLCQPGLSRETWLLVGKFMGATYHYGKLEVDSIRRWMVDYVHPIRGIVPTVGPYMCLGEYDRAPTMGEVIDAANALATWLKETCLQSSSPRLQREYGQNLERIEQWWMTSKDEKPGFLEQQLIKQQQPGPDNWFNR
ncbi:hypothetical protein PRZ48_014055 [Zasmidium cellare]|uniref:F-box domain-containing protein n=1 Tax=Zasmidium cellare TaxID=395010 RepID=A0ABR0E024_ZASCE|nr:hypothetical protein PRZ48_014055 [Zasmidium cellare]